MKRASWLLVLGLAMPAAAEVQTRIVEYRDGDTVLEGYLAWDDSFGDKRPGVLVVHEWYGLNEYAKSRARQLAEMGYLAFAADIYGKGRRASNRQEAAALTGPFREDRGLMRSRARAALQVLKTQAMVAPNHVAAIGYCFGGTCVLELARSGADFQAAVSFHGGLSTPEPRDAKNIKAKVLVLHGAADPHVPMKEVAAFAEEMESADVDWQLVMYGGAVHAFSNPDSGDDPSSGAAYDADADRRSWEHMKLFFSETIGLPEKAGGVGHFMREKVAEPTVEGAKAAGEAAKKAAVWTWKKVTGDE